MNLRTEITDRLWEAVSNAYEAGNYSHAVLESVHLITEVLREKSGLDGDGNPLVGAALGGDSPKIRLNSLQTDTERNVQKGFESILRGMYSAIRNPRSHESASDLREHADAIICFVNYLLTILDASKEVFSTESFMARVTDPDFVDTKRYSKLLVDQIPPARIGDTLIALFSARRDLPLQKRETLIEALLKAASESQLQSLMAVVSDELKLANDSVDIKTAFQMLTPELWSRVEESARLRIETKIIGGIRKGKVTADGSTTEWLSTWARDFLKSFTLKDEAATALWLKLMDDDADERHYCIQFFFGVFPGVLTTNNQIDRGVKGVVSAMRKGDKHMRRALLDRIDHLPEQWQSKLIAALSDLTDREKPAKILNSGEPFLKADEESDFDDDIPF